MKISMWFTAIALILLGGGHVEAQIAGNSNRLNIQDMRTFGEVFNISQRENGNRFGLDFRSEGVDGSPFLFERSYPAFLVMKSGDTLSQAVDVNIDLENHEVFIVLEDGEGGIIPARSLKRVVFNDPEVKQAYAVLPDAYIRQSRSKQYRLYEVIFEDDLQFYRGESRKLIKSNKNTSYSVTGGLNDKYMANESYFLCDNSKGCHQIKLRGKDIMKSLEQWGYSTRSLNKADEKAKSVSDIIALLEKL